MEKRRSARSKPDVQPAEPSRREYANIYEPDLYYRPTVPGTSALEQQQDPFKQQVCQLKYKCAASLCILCVLLLEAVARRLEESFRPAGGLLQPSQSQLPFPFNASG